MLKWCSYCQRFMHEIVPYDDFRMTHGFCPACMSAHENVFANHVVERAQILRRIFTALFDAGRHEDFEAASQIIETAIAANCRPVDILMGMISPMLYEIGEEWKRGALSVDAEHRFTDFSEKVVGLVEARIGSAMAASPAPSNGTLLFLMNAPGNRHDLAVRILSIWLECHGTKVRMVEDDMDRDRFMRSITAERPKYLLISMAVTDQRDAVAGIARAVEALPQDIRPKTIVGGYPIKAGLIDSIPDAELIPDISALQIA